MAMRIFPVPKVLDMIRENDQKKRRGWNDGVYRTSGNMNEVTVKRMADDVEVRRLDRGLGKTQALYKQICGHLRQQIESGELGPGEPLPKLSTMVNHWKVNYRTIHTALESLKEEGLVDWTPGRGSRPIVIKNPAIQSTIMYVRWGRDALHLEVMRGMTRFAAEKSLECLVVETTPSPEQYLNAIAHAPQAAAGMLILPLHAKGGVEAIQAAMKAGVKVVFIDRVLEGIEASSVAVDHVAGAHQITKDLLVRHAGPVHYLTYDSHTSATRDRYEGWAAAMHEGGFHDLKEYVWSAVIEESTVEKAAIQAFSDAASDLLKKRGAGRCSILGVNDYAAKGVYWAAEELELKIGTDVFVAGFGDLPLCTQLPVPLSSMKQHNEQVGYEAAKLLFLQMKGILTRPVHRRIPGEFCARASTGS
jgi:GntR family transcriptional regulator, arabinose operon transcriptional repressor